MLLLLLQPTVVDSQLTKSTFSSSLADLQFAVTVRHRPIPPDSTSFPPSIIPKRCSHPSVLSRRIWIGDSHTFPSLEITKDVTSRIYRKQSAARCPWSRSAPPSGGPDWSPPTGAPCPPRRYEMGGPSPSTGERALHAVSCVLVVNIEEASRDDDDAICRHVGTKMLLLLRLVRSPGHITTREAA